MSRFLPRRAAPIARWPIGALAFVLVVGGCRGEDATGKTGEPIVEPPRGAVTAPELPYSPPAPSGDVLGHVRVADPFALVAKVSGQLAPPGQDGAVTVDALRRAAQRAADGPVGKALALHFDPGRVAGCALLDPGAHAIPIACVFGFQSGLDQLVSDLGPTGRQPTSGPGAARYEVEGLTVHLHALGPDVVVAFDDTAFATSREYLQALTARGGEWDVELTLHARAAIDHLRPALDAVAGDLMSRARSLSDDPIALAVTQAAAPALAVLAPIASEHGEQVMAELYDMGAQVDVLRLGARLDDEGLALALHARPVPGSELAVAVDSGKALPVELLESVPRHTWLLWLARTSARDVLPATGAFVRRSVAALGADALGVGGMGLSELFVERDPDHDAHYGDARALVLFNGPGTWGGAAVLRSGPVGEAARDAWRTSASTADPEALIGPEAAAELAKILRWRFVPEAFAIDGTTVDRFLVEPAPRFEKKLAATLSDDELAAQIVAWIGAKPALFTIDRFDTGANAAFVLAPGGSEAYARRIAGTTEAEQRMPHAQLDAWLARSGVARFVLAASLRDLAEFLHAALPADLLASLPKTSGRGLGDVALVGGLDEAGAWRLELRITQPVIDVVRRAFAPATPGA